MRIAIVIYYQIFDKIGYYLNDELSLGLEKNKKYFKEVEKAIESKDLVCKELIFEDEAYGQIRILRQCLIHNKSKFIDYKNDWEKLTSLIVFDYERIQKIIYGFFKDYGIVASERAKNELKRKIEYTRL